MSSYPRKILVAMDFSDVSRRALEAALDLASTSGASVCAMHAFQGSHGPHPDTAPRDVDGAKQSLATMIANRHHPEIAVAARVDEGDPRAAILDAADAIGADLIVMGTHARSGMPRGLLGSVAESVIRTSPVAVLTIRERLPRTV
jgi:nucleotide-binding universal stress UspA family protein